MSKNKVARTKTLEKLCGSQVEVHPLGTVKPENLSGDIVYVPLPEYGVCLVRQKPVSTPRPGGERFCDECGESLNKAAQIPGVQYLRCVCGAMQASDALSLAMWEFRERLLSHAEQLVGAQKGLNKTLSHVEYAAGWTVQIEEAKKVVDEMTKAAAEYHKIFEVKG